MNGRAGGLGFGLALIVLAWGGWAVLVRESASQERAIVPAVEGGASNGSDRAQDVELDSPSLIERGEASGMAGLRDDDGVSDSEVASDRDGETVLAAWQQIDWKACPELEPNREQWVRENRWAYIEGNKDSIRRWLGELAGIEDTGRSFQKAGYIVRTAICVLMAERGLGDYMAAGESYPAGTPEEGARYLMEPFWNYLVSESEYPEYQQSIDLSPYSSSPGDVADFMDRAIRLAESAIAD